MPDASDMELLQDYERQGSEDAFAELVRRHINLVYSVALRHVGIAAQAEEITQAVFVILARKAAGLRPDTILEGWLHETTRLTALSFLRGERRRQFREQEAYMQSTLQESADTSTWNQLAPLLDEAVSRLGKKDRDAVMLRFFKKKSLREVAVALKVNETAAQRRVHRAVEKLRLFFTKRGVALSGVAITGAISANSVQAAPVALAKSVTAVAIGKGAAASGSTLTLIKGALKIMAWTKAKTAIVAAVAVILAAGTTTLAVKHQHRAKEPMMYATPEAALQSSLLAMSKGDMKMVLASFTPEFQKAFMETAGKGKSESDLAAQNIKIAAMIGNFQAVSNEVISSDETILHFLSSQMGAATVPMKKIEGEWKINGNVTTDGPGRGVRK
jgi:RNA polymerase sigma factor (sigma-70 family)